MDHCSDRHIHNYESASQYVRCHNAAPTTPTEPHKPAAAVRTSHYPHRGEGSPVLTSYVTQEQTARSGTNNAPPLTSRRYRIKGGDTCSADTVCEEFPPLKLVPVQARFENMQPSRSATYPSAAPPGSPRRPFRFTDVRLAKYQPLFERTQCMHHGNHGRPPR